LRLLRLSDRLRIIAREQRRQDKDSCVLSPTPQSYFVNIPFYYLHLFPDYNGNTCHQKTCTGMLIAAQKVSHYPLTIEGKYIVSYPFPVATI
jgi:hypothetical protein